MAYTKQTWTDRQGTKLNKFIKTNETLTTVELTNSPDSITQDGTPFSKTRMDYIEEGIRTGHVIGTPLSDLSRMFQLNGNGIPQFPDNAAGTLQRYAGFTSTSGITPTNCSLSVSAGELVVTLNDSAWNIQFPAMASIQNKLIAIELIAPVGKVANLAVIYPPIAVKPFTTTGVDQIVIGYNTDAATTVMINNVSGWVAGDVIRIRQLYVGSGLYDTPVYGKDGQSVWENHGVVPVNGKRGKAMLFQGGQWMVANGPLTGATGTLRFKIKTSATLLSGFLFSNIDSSSGFAIYQNDGGATAIPIGGSTDSLNIGTLSPSTEYTFSLYFASNHLYIYRNGSSFIDFALTKSMVPAVLPMVIGAGADTNNKQAFTLYDIQFVAEAETLDSHIRYHNGDDAVDSQQKAVTAVPHSIVTRDANGGINASNMYAYDLVIDSDAKLALWAASGTWEKVLIKKGTWTLASGGVNLEARGTKVVIGEPGSKLVFSSAASGLSYNTVPTSNEYYIKGVSVEVTGNGSGSALAFYGCINLYNCTGKGTGGVEDSGTGFSACRGIYSCKGIGIGVGSGSRVGRGFSGCDLLFSCIGEGTGAGTGYGAGFFQCTQITGCDGKGYVTGSSYGYGFYSCTAITLSRGLVGEVGFFECKKCQQNTSATTPKYGTSYADAGTSYPCADTPNGGFNS